MHLLGAEATEAFEGARATLAQFVGADSLRGDRLHQERLRGAEPVRPHARRRAPAGRRDRHLGDGAPLQHRSLAAAGRADRRDAALVRRHRRGPARPGRRPRAEGLINERTKIVSVAYVSNVLGTVNPITRDRRPRPRGRRHGGGRRLAGRAAAAGRRRRPRCRPGRVHRPQDGRPDRHRRALGPLRPAGRAAAVPRRRRDDRGRHDDRLDVRATAAPVRGRHARRSPRPSGWPPPPSYLERDRHGPDRRARAGDHRVRAGGPARTCPGCGSSARPSRSTAAARSRSPCHRRRHPIHPHDVSQLLDSRGIAVRGGHHCARPLHERFGVQSSTRASFYLYTTQRRDRRPGRRARTTSEHFFGGRPVKVEELYQEIILDHYRAKHHSGLREPYEAEVHHVNPSCGDEVTLRVHLDGGHGHRRLLRGCRLLDLPGLDLGDERSGDRPRRRPRTRAARGVPDPDAGPGSRSSRTRTGWRTASPSPASPGSPPG